MPNLFLPYPVEPFTVFGLISDHANYLAVAGVARGRLDNDVVDLVDDEHASSRFVMSFLASSGDEAKRLARDFVERGRDDTEGALEDLRLALYERLHECRKPIPGTVTFKTTHVDGAPVYDARRATLHYTDATTVETQFEFKSTPVEDVLDAIAEDTPPVQGGPLTVRLIPNELTSGPAAGERAS